MLAERRLSDGILVLTPAGEFHYHELGHLQRVVQAPGVHLVNGFDELLHARVFAKWTNVRQRSRQ